MADFGIAKICEDLGSENFFDENRVRQEGGSGSGIPTHNEAYDSSFS